MTCPDSETLARRTSGELDAHERATLDDHLKSCEPCRQTAAELDGLADRLGADPGEFDDPAFADDVMTLIRLGRTEPRRTPPPIWRRSPWVAAAAATVTALAATLVFVLSPALKPGAEGTGLAARGGAAAEADRWVSLDVFHQSDKGFVRVDAPIETDEALAFAYRDQSPAPFSFLMVFAVDGRGEVFWYYPAHTDPTKNPKSMFTHGTNARAQLPDATKHDLVAGPLRVFALFSNDAMDVSSVERLVAETLAQNADIRTLKRLPIPESGQQSLLLEVE